MKKENKKVLTIIDADSIIFTVGYKFRNKKVKAMVEMETAKFISDVVRNTKCTHFIGFYGSKEEGAKPNFRYEVDPNYKANRPETPDFVTKWRPTIHEVFKTKWGFSPVEAMEADDAVAIAAEHYRDEFDEIVICTFDKDLKQIPNSTFYNMRTHESEVINEFKAMHYLGLQALSGDSTDNIKGIPKIGPKKAAAALKECKTVGEIKYKVLRMYQEYFESIRKSVQSDVKSKYRNLLEVDPEDPDSKIPEEYKGLSKARIDRKVRIQSKKEVEELLRENFPDGIKSYLKVQLQLLVMLTESPDGFEIPELRESPFVVEEEEVTVASVSASDMLEDDMLTI